MTRLIQPSRSRPAVVGVLAGLLLVVSRAPGYAHEDHGGPGLDPASLLQRWAVVDGIDRSARRDEITAFFHDLSFEELCGFCGEVDTDADSRAVQTLARNGLLAKDIAGSDLVTFLGVPGIHPSCVEAGLAVATRDYDRFAAPDRDRLSDILLDRVDGDLVDPQRRTPVEHLAYRFGQTERLWKRFEAYLLSPSDSVRAYGAEVARASTDQRVADSMVTFFRSAIEEPDDYPTSLPALARTAAVTGQAAALPALEKLLWRAPIWERQRPAVEVLQEIRHPRTLSFLVKLYADLDRAVAAHATPHDSTLARELPDRLYHATRRLEGVITAALRGSRDQEAREAELLVARAVERGPFVQPDRLVEALKDFAVNDRGRDQARIAELVDRIQASSGRRAPPPRDRR